jgi:zinc protease
VAPGPTTLAAGDLLSASSGPASTVSASRVLSVSTAAGARAVLMRDPARPLVATSLRFAAGSAADPAGRSGLAHVLEHLMFCGTRRFGRGGHMNLIQAMGGFANATTSADWTRHFHVVPPDLLTVFLELEAERLVQAPEAMTDQALAIERDVVLSERRQRMDSVPYGDCAERLLEALYPADSPYRWLPIGSAQDVRRVDLGDCLAFHAAYYVATRACFAIVGDFDPDRLAGPVLGLLEVLGAGPGGTPPSPEPGAASRSVAAASRIEVTSRYRPKLFVGCLLPPAATWEFELARFAGLYLGRGLSAALPDRLVKRDQLAASVVVKTMAREAGASVGIIEIVPRDGVSIEAVLAGLDAVLSEAAGGGVTEAELARTKAVYRSSWLADDDAFVGRSDSLSLAMQVNGSAEEYLGHDERIGAIELDDLRQAVGCWHQPARRVELSYRP